MHFASLARMTIGGF